MHAAGCSLWGVNHTPAVSLHAAAIPWCIDADCTAAIAAHVCEKTASRELMRFEASFFNLHKPHFRDAVGPSGVSAEISRYTVMQMYCDKYSTV